ncbi:hypothetical protein LDENG_00183420 [Lucifuga dentata]|nr:hypothetical protein LDENG_00183420 [Lucifuga dentata]
MCLYIIALQREWRLLIGRSRKKNHMKQKCWYCGQGEIRKMLDFLLQQQQSQHAAVGH